MVTIIEQIFDVLDKINFSAIDDINKNLKYIFLLAGNIVVLFQIAVLIF